MPAVFNNKKESFINETETKSSIVTTFITITFVLTGMVLAGLLLWAYMRSETLFIVVLSVIVMLYCGLVVGFIAHIRSKLTENEFKILMTSSIFMGLFIITIFIYFLVKAVPPVKQTSNNNSNSNRNNNSQPYVSQNLAKYANNSD
jgi:Na+(H+)/acetate symporter ActP